MVRIGMIANLLRSTLLSGATLLLVGTATDATRFARPSPAPPLHRPGHGVLFADDFSSGTLKGWTPDRLDVWSVSHGMLRADLPDQKQVRSLLYAGDTSWTNVAVDLDVCMMRGVDKGVVVRVGGTSGMGVDLRGGSYQDVLMYLRDWPMGRANATNANGAWNHLRVVASGDRFRVFVNGELKIDRPDARSARRSGRIALPAYTGGVGQCTVYYDNVVVTALD
jgi:hypothetical protein